VTRQTDEGAQTSAKTVSVSPKLRRRRRPIDAAHLRPMGVHAARINPALSESGALAKNSSSPSAGRLISVPLARRPAA